MRAPTVVPLQAGSAAVTEMPDPEPGAGELLVEGIALGVCGTDREIMDGVYGWAPPGEERFDPRPRVARPGARGAARQWLRRR